MTDPVRAFERKERGMSDAESMRARLDGRLARATVEFAVDELCAIAEGADDEDVREKVYGVARALERWLSPEAPGES